MRDGPIDPPLEEDVRKCPTCDRYFTFKDEAGLDVYGPALPWFDYEQPCCSLGCRDEYEEECDWEWLTEFDPEEVITRMQDTR